MSVLSILAFYNSVVSVVYDEIIFHVELNISAASVVSDKTIFQVILIVSAVGVVNDEIIFNVVLEISVVSVVNYHHFWGKALGNIFLTYTWKSAQLA